VRAAEVVEELAVGGSFLERVQFGAVQVLQQRIPEHVVVGGPTHDRRDHAQPGLLRRPPPPLAHDQLEALAAERPHDHGLEEPDLLDRAHQLGQRVGVDHLPRLPLVRHDRTDGELGEVAGPVRIRRSRRSRRLGRDDDVLIGNHAVVGIDARPAQEERRDRTVTPVRRRRGGDECAEAPAESSSWTAHEACLSGLVEASSRAAST